MKKSYVISLSSKMEAEQTLDSLRTMASSNDYISVADIMKFFNETPEKLDYLRGWRAVDMHNSFIETIDPCEFRIVIPSWPRMI